MQYYLLGALPKAVGYLIDVYRNNNKIGILQIRLAKSMYRPSSEFLSACDLQTAFSDGAASIDYHIERASTDRRATCVHPTMRWDGQYDISNMEIDSEVPDRRYEPIPK